MPLPIHTTYARTLARRWLTESCTITDPGTPLRTAAGGSMAGTPVVYPNVPCRVAPKGAQPVLAQFSEQVLASADWVVFLARDTPVGGGWRVDLSGVSYAVIAVAQGTGAAFRQALLTQQEAI